MVKIYIREASKRMLAVDLKNPYELWISQVSESEATKQSYQDGICVFEVWAAENYGLEAKEVPKRWREAKYKSMVARERFLDELNDVLRDYFGYVKGRYTPLGVNRLMSTVMSYLHSFDIPVKPLRLRYPHVIYHNRDIGKDEIRRILDHSDVRNRAIYITLYESGMRPNTLVNLRYRHIKDEFLANRIPMKIELTPDILKCRVSIRWTFIGEDGFEALKRYLMATRWPLKSEDYLFVSEKPKERRLKSGAVSQAFNKLVQRLGMAEAREGKKPKDLRLYCLKSAFRKFMDAEEAYKEFWMGRTTTKTHYVSKDPEYHRQLYAKGYENLRLYKPEVDAETIAKLTRENQELKQRVDRLETVLEELADIKAQIKREEKLLS